MSPSGSGGPSHACRVPTSPAGPDAAAQDEPLPLSGFAASPNMAASAYVTEDTLAAALDWLNWLEGNWLEKENRYFVLTEEQKAG